MDVEKEVKKTVEKYGLIGKGEKVAVALSGGKDSTSVLYILNKLGYDVRGLMIDLKMGAWSETHKKNMEEFCEKLGVPLTIVDMREEFGQGMPFIKEVVRRKKNITGCSVCGIIKRWILNRWAKKLGADKLATGHNLDDEAQNVLMNFMKGNVFLGLNSSPATGSENVEGFVRRIKPLFFVPEDEVRKYAQKKNFKILDKPCPCAFGTYRVETRGWMKDISNEQKLKIVKGFQEVVKRLRKNNKLEIRKCERCGEPARGRLCNACKVLELAGK